MLHEELAFLGGIASFEMEMRLNLKTEGTGAKVKRGLHFAEQT